MSKVGNLKTCGLQLLAGWGIVGLKSLEVFQLPTLDTSSVNRTKIRFFLPTAATSLPTPCKLLLVTYRTTKPPIFGVQRTSHADSQRQCPTGARLQANLWDPSVAPVPAPKGKCWVSLLCHLERGSRGVCQPSTMPKLYCKAEAAYHRLGLCGCI